MLRAGFAAFAAALLLVSFGYDASAQDAGTHIIEGAPGLAPPEKLIPRFAVIPYKGGKAAEQLSAESAAVSTIPLWQHSIKAGVTNYTYQMVGKNPFVKQAVPKSTIKTVIVPIKFIFRKGGSTSTILFASDPTKSDPTCSPKGTPLAMVKNSPVFKTVSNFKAGTTNIGSGQIIALFQRAEFWSETKRSGINPGYEVNLSIPVVFPLQTVTVTNAHVLNGTCSKLGTLDINAWDPFVQKTLMPKLAKAGYGPTAFPNFLFYNVVLYDGKPASCCILGYHSAFNNPKFNNNFQTYSNEDYDTSGAFGGGVSDISVTTHEVAEWMNDPTGLNPTPPWGHTGQVSGCQANLEVGDPLSGTIKPLTLNGFTYHIQDLAFLSWFYHQAKSIGVNGWYSFYGTFKTAAKPCT